MQTYCTKFVSTIQHAKRRTPSCVTMERDFEGSCDATLDLERLELLNPLTRSLDLYNTIHEVRAV